MRAMRLTRSSRSIVALLTAVLLLVCQTAFAVQACAYSASASEPASFNAPPCHEVEAPASGAPAVPQMAAACDAGKAVFDGAKLQIPPVADLAAIRIAYVDTGARASCARSAQLVQAVCYSPPLSILHCRLLN
ncbi:MAG TPA: hypothetical protein VED01_22440 [Burkholderiales bacterium]|nr:hypothetical protein [Burkholderiales bacterium]